MRNIDYRFVSNRPILRRHQERTPCLEGAHGPRSTARTLPVPDPSPHKPPPCRGRARYPTVGSFGSNHVGCRRPIPSGPGLYLHGISRSASCFSSTLKLSITRLVGVVRQRLRSSATISRYCSCVMLRFSPKRASANAAAPEADPDRYRCHSKIDLSAPPDTDPPYAIAGFWIALRSSSSLTNQIEAFVDHLWQALHPRAIACEPERMVITTKPAARPRSWPPGPIPRFHGRALPYRLQQAVS